MRIALFAGAFALAFVFSTCTAARAEMTGGIFALSFDDGPEQKANRTGQILDVIEEEGVTATFCLVGAAVDTDYGRRIVRRMRDMKIEFCNHSYSHPVLTSANVVLQIEKTDKAIGKALGIEGFKSRVLRKPFGAGALGPCYDGRPFVGWGEHGDSNDYRRSGKHVLQIASHLPSGEILLLHDRHEPPERVREIIRSLKARGAIFVHASGLWKHQCTPRVAGR